jgi:penicillin G amidase
MRSKTAKTLCLGSLCISMACQGPDNETVAGKTGEGSRASTAVVTSGVASPVEVYRDKWGISHVFAQSNADLFFVQGYVTASDRLFNMDFNRRQASGRLAEVFGKALVADDRLIRTVGLTRIGQAGLDNATPATREAIDAYTRGVNAYIEQHRDNLPEEFRIVGYTPEPWTALDSVICWKWFSWALTGGWRADAALAQVIDKVGARKAREVFPFYIKGAPTIIGKGELKLPSTPPIPTSTTEGLDDEGEGTYALNLNVGSNGWVVNGSKSVTGKPLLASNSHLLMTVPSGYYEIQLTGGDYDVTGVSIPGTPGIFLGHNRSIGWAVTRDAIDDVDIFIEKVDPANALRYEHKGKWLEMTAATETIKVKGEQPIPLEIRSTIHGPVFSEFTGDKDRVVTLKWIGHDIVANEIEPHLGINRASTFDAFRESLRHYTIGGINYHYADTAGNIGVVSAGAIPIRASGRGNHSVPGWAGEFDWTSVVPYEHNPFLYNPARGYIDSANNKIIDEEEYPYYIGSRSSPYRAELIRDHMKAKQKFSIEDFKRMHSDVLAAPPRHMLPTVLPVLQRFSLSQAAKQALSIVEAWDHRFDSDSTGASIYDRFVTVLIRNTFKDEVGDDLFQRFFTGIGMEEIIKTQSAWFDDVTTPVKETRDAMVGKSFEAAVAELATQLGADQSQWQWKKVNVVWINHRTPLSNDPVHGKRLNLGPFQQDGKRGWTINPVNGDIYEQIVDLSDIDNSIAMMPPGNSERVDSPNYRDQVDLWVRGEYHPSFLSRNLVEGAAIEHTVFRAK